MATAKLRDPVDAGKEDAEEASFVQQMQEADPTRLDPNEIGSMPESAARTPHPFSGYPLGRKVTLVGSKTPISSTWLVILRDPSAVFQDVSGKGVTHQVIAKDKEGKDIKPMTADGKYMAPKIKASKIINLKTSHNRVTTNYDDGSGQSMDWVFDRKIMVGENEMTCCVVPSHSARAQIFLRLSKKGKIEIDRRYMLADTKQGNRLRRVFKNINYQQLAGERAAQQFDSDPSDQDRQE